MGLEIPPRGFLLQDLPREALVLALLGADRPQDGGSRQDRPACASRLLRQAVSLRRCRGDRRWAGRHGGGDGILIDENPKLGGCLNYARFDESGEAACKADGDLVNAVKAAANIKVMTDAVVSGLFADNWITI